MRLTRESLLKIAKDAAAQQVRVSRRIVCIYLTGSLLTDDPLLGGVGDIDLIFIHDSEPIQPREIIRLNDEVHLDIGHYAQTAFRQPRHLRTDPWLGSFIYDKPLVLHDTQHWFEFTQASSSAQFFHPDNALRRATALVQSARQVWTELSLSSSAGTAETVGAYLQAIENAGNAVACLTDVPLTDRRFFLKFPQRAQAVKRPDLAAQLISLISDPSVKLDSYWNDWLTSWKAAFTEASHQPGAPARLHPARLLYYEKAAVSLWQEHPIASLWILLRTWSLAANCLSPDSAALEGWKQVCQVLKLDGEHMEERLNAFDHTLDMIEETLDSWGKENGASSAL